MEVMVGVYIEFPTFKLLCSVKLVVAFLLVMAPDQDLAYYYWEAGRGVLELLLITQVNISPIVPFLL